MNVFMILVMAYVWFPSERGFAESWPSKVPLVSRSFAHAKEHNHYWQNFENDGRQPSGKIGMKYPEPIGTIFQKCSDTIQQQGCTAVASSVSCTVVAFQLMCYQSGNGSGEIVKFSKQTTSLNPPLTRIDDGEKGAKRRFLTSAISRVTFLLSDSTDQVIDSALRLTTFGVQGIPSDLDLSSEVLAAILDALTALLSGLDRNAVDQSKGYLIATHFQENAVNWLSEDSGEDDTTEITDDVCRFDTNNSAQ